MCDYTWLAGAPVWTQEGRRRGMHGGPPARCVPPDFWLLTVPGSTQVKMVSGFLDLEAQFISLHFSIGVLN